MYLLLSKIYKNVFVNLCLQTLFSSVDFLYVSESAKNFLKMNSWIIKQKLVNQLLS